MEGFPYNIHSSTPTRLMPKKSSWKIHKKRVVSSMGTLENARFIRKTIVSSMEALEMQTLIHCMYNYLQFIYGLIV